ncbi:MAG: sugar transferase [Bacillota bacterium]|nr:sugar transferase [Bacillota bacterium]
MKAYELFKRLFDFLLALVIFVVILPFFALISLLIIIESPGPVFFKQKRVGKNKNLFYILKFRTMRKETPGDVATHLLNNPTQYITKVGRLLRKFSIDEVPQLINILKGEMSFIGPRPALWNQFDLIELRDKYGANNVLPGLTGLAQIKGRDELPLEEKACYDGLYSKNLSLLQDLKIFLITPFVVLTARGFSDNHGKKEKTQYHNYRKPMMLTSANKPIILLFISSIRKMFL